ncbi:hypothetical protein MHBO_001039, partial [Bonamia ostreae]
NCKKYPKEKAKIYCKNNQIYLLNNNENGISNVFSQKLFLEKCFRCDKNAIFNQNLVKFECFSQTENEFKIGEKCKFFCENGFSVFGKNLDHFFVVCTKNGWNYDFEKEISCKIKSNFCFFAGLPLNLISINSTTNGIENKQQINATCTKSGLKALIYCDNGLFKFNGNQNVDENNTNSFCKPRKDCSLESLVELMKRKNFMLTTTNCVLKNQNDKNLEKFCETKCNALNDLNYNKSINLDKRIYCVDFNFMYKDNFGELKSLKLNDGVFECKMKRGKACKLSKIENFHFKKTALEYEKECINGINLDPWEHCVL